MVSRFFRLMKGPASGSSSCVRTVSESVLRVMVFLSSCPSVWGCGSCDKAGSLWKLKVWQRVEPPMHVLPLSLLVFRYDHAVLRLGLTRSAERTGKEEMVVIDRWYAVRWLRKACHRRAAEKPVLEKGGSDFPQVLQVFLNTSSPDALHFNVYSLHRGGATRAFLSHQSIERALLRGR